MRQSYWQINTLILGGYNFKNGRSMEIKDYHERRSKSRRKRWLFNQGIWARNIEMQNGETYYLLVSQIIFQSIKEPGRIRNDCLNVNLAVPKERGFFQNALISCMANMIGMMYLFAMRSHARNMTRKI